MARRAAGYPPAGAAVLADRLRRLPRRAGRRDLAGVHDALRGADRERSGRDPEPSAGSSDRQTVRTTEAGGQRGYDGGKRLVGRKRPLVGDTEGRLLGMDVHDADRQDPDAGKDLLEVAKGEPPHRR